MDLTEGQRDTALAASRVAVGNTSLASATDIHGKSRTPHHDYVTGYSDKKTEATNFVPVKNAEDKGKVVIKGLEDDTYCITELTTDNGYTLLADHITVVIKTEESNTSCTVYQSDVLGLLQNDPRYADIINDNGQLKNMPQKQLEHKLMSAAATIDNQKVTMRADENSANALAPLTVVNTRGFDLPRTGDRGTWMYSVFGILLMAGAGAILVLNSRKYKRV